MTSILDKELLAEISNGKESDTIEFKEAQGKDGKGQIPKSVYETVCSFSNHYGGNIYLGIGDDGKILGLDPSRIESMKKEFVTSIQSNNKITPPLYLNINEFKIHDKFIFNVFVPNSSQIHRLNGNFIYDRNEDADINVTNITNSVQQIYTRKQSEYTENKVFPYIEITDFRSDLIDRIRNVAIDSNGDMLFKGKSDIDVLKGLSMYKKDFLTNTEGYTMAAVLVFGKDYLIKSVLSYFYIDVLVRFRNTERYDDRLRISTNLIDSYDLIMKFFAKYISEPFYLEGDTRVDLREKLLREVVVNLLVHREYSNPFMSRIEIWRNKITFINANKPVHPGMVKEGDIFPFAKNPSIANVFHILGLIDEIGSGMGKIFKYSPILFGAIPIIENEDEFRVKLPISSKGISNLSILSETKADESTQSVELTSNQRLALKKLVNPMRSRELASFFEMISYDSFRKSVLVPLLEKGLIERTIPNKPKSPKQKYRRVIK